AVRDDGDAAVELLPRHSPAVVLAGEQPPLEIAGESVGAVGWLLEHGHALAGDVLHALVVVDVAEEQIAPLFPPERALGRPERPAESVGQIVDRLRRRDDLLELGRQLLDALGRLGRRTTD